MLLSNSHTSNTCHLILGACLALAFCTQVKPLNLSTNALTFQALPTAPTSLLPSTVPKSKKTAQLLKATLLQQYALNVIGITERLGIIKQQVYATLLENAITDPMIEKGMWAWMTSGSFCQHIFVTSNELQQEVKGVFTGNPKVYDAIWEENVCLGVVSTTKTSRQMYIKAHKGMVWYLIWTANTKQVSEGTHIATILYMSDNLQSIGPITQQSISTFTNAVNRGYATQGSKCLDTLQAPKLPIAMYKAMLKEFCNGRVPLLSLYIPFGTSRAQLNLFGYIIRVIMTQLMARIMCRRMVWERNCEYKQVMEIIVKGTNMFFADKVMLVDDAKAICNGSEFEKLLENAKLYKAVMRGQEIWVLIYQNEARDEQPGKLFLRFQLTRQYLRLHQYLSISRYCHPEETRTVREILFSTVYGRTGPSCFYEGLPADILRETGIIPLDGVDFISPEKIAILCLFLEMHQRAASFLSIFGRDFTIKIQDMCIESKGTLVASLDSLLPPGTLIMIQCAEEHDKTEISTTSWSYLKLDQDGHCHLKSTRLLKWGETLTEKGWVL